MNLIFSRRSKRFGVGLGGDLLALQRPPDLVAQHVGLHRIGIQFQGGNRDGDIKGPHAASVARL